jgi:hypothetical protein
MRDLAERFWSKVAKRGPDDCWLWRGSLSDKGYGQLRIGSRTDGSRRLLVASRLSYELHSGRVPAGMDVCHRCDNPACVNPAHLFLGTRSANIRDAVAKGRLTPPVLRGSRNGNARLTAGDVVAIRTRRGLGERAAALAAELGVSVETIYRVARRAGWAHVADSILALEPASSSGSSATTGPTPDRSLVPPTSGDARNAPTLGQGSHDRASRGGPEPVEVEA